MGTIVSLFGLLPEALKPDISFKIVSGLCYGMQSSSAAGAPLPRGGGHSSGV